MLHCTMVNVHKGKGVVYMYARRWQSILLSAARVQPIRLSLSSESVSYSAVFFFYNKLFNSTYCQLSAKQC